ncbi:hypothetical protein ACFQY6_02580 [Legionella taurinensis]|uniref:hypothetical protein n=1 Tax=Legionella taurinensis TaxID=70611 RepID=UPI000DFB2169|nr:hypothetical protein [Legionella taurinensis]STY26203.1 Uncharacterised protein [Legionella taurinensis]
MPSLIDIALKDFPRSEIWRVQTDGWQAKKGPSNFRPQFYQGMKAGFDYLRKHDREPVTPALIEGLYHSFTAMRTITNPTTLLEKATIPTWVSLRFFCPSQDLRSRQG